MLTRGRWLLLILLAGSLTVAGTLTYKRWPHLLTKPKRQNSNAGLTSELSTTPPFSTREPDRYQATRIITVTESNNGQAPPAITTTHIARDGNSRREEYENGAEGTVIYLETEQSRFILLPARKIYADLNSASDPASSDPQGEIASAPDFSPDRLLHQTPTLQRFEKLGPERINDRATTKYRVTNANDSAGTVTVIWIDDALGLPVRSESRSGAADHPTTVTVELRDLKQIVDASVFALPTNYSKVGYGQVYSELSKTGMPLDREKAKP